MNRLKHRRILSECIDFLNSNGVEVNGDLEKLIGYFFETEKHMSIDDMRKYAHENGSRVSESSIRNAFNLLVEYGFASEKIFNDNIQRYEHLHPGEHHDHFYCLKCGKIIEFCSPLIEQAQEQEAQNRGFYIFSHKMQIYGLCDKCMKKPQTSPMTLRMIDSGGKFQVESIDSAQNSVFTKRIMDIGIVAGMTGEVIANHGGHLVLLINGTRVALGKEMANKIKVTLI
ncbi:MAG: transcriptional repressor [Fibrobacter sp.]|nr:transcriptional repressor [Fibrobacter sp.]